VKTPDQMTFLADLLHNDDSLDFWIEPRLHAHADIRMDRAQYETLKVVFDELEMEHSVWIENVGEIIKNQILPNNDTVPLDFFDQYNSYEEIIDFITDLEVNYPNLVRLRTIGQSYQGRDLVVVSVTSSTGGPNKPGLFFDGGIHAREWISPATALYILNTLVTTYDSDPEIKALVDGLNIWVLPVFNPDGYTYSRSGSNQRLWRKSRSPNAGSTCIGTDLNRNWAFRWGGEGASASPCSETFRGSRADSEPEVAIISRFIVAAANNIKGYINFHSYSQVWLGPWGFTTQVPADVASQNEISRRVTAAITSVYGTAYQYGPSSTTLYITSGSSVDFTYSNGIIWSFTIELRDTGSYGFLLPPTQIKPSGIETLAGWKVFAKHIIDVSANNIN
jgi:murein tripeptide amidase MpaA